MGTSPHASYQMYNETKVYEGDWYINVDVKHDESHDENHWLDMWPKWSSSRGSPRCAVLSCWGAPTQKKSLFLLLLLLFFQKKNIKFKVALRPRLGLKPMVISVSNHGRRVVKPGTPSSTSCVSAVTSLVHSKHLTWWHRPTQAESTKRKSRPTLVIQNSEPWPVHGLMYIHTLRWEIPFWRDLKREC